MRNFHTYNNFFKTVIDVNMIIFYIIFTKYKDINKYKKQLINSNWLEEISKLRNLNLKLF